jgi:hypothetical protein
LQNRASGGNGILGVKRAENKEKISKILFSCGAAAKPPFFFAAKQLFLFSIYYFIISPFSSS